MQPVTSIRWGPIRTRRCHPHGTLRALHRPRRHGRAVLLPRLRHRRAYDGVGCAPQSGAVHLAQVRQVRTDKLIDHAVRGASALRPDEQRREEAGCQHTVASSRPAGHSDQAASRGRHAALPEWRRTDSRMSMAGRAEQLRGHRRPQKLRELSALLPKIADEEQRQDKIEAARKKRGGDVP
jgi:hypothetical protein